MDAEPDYQLTEVEAHTKRERDAVLALLTTGLDDIPTVVRRVAEYAASHDDRECDSFLWSLWPAVFDAAGEASSDKQISDIVEFLMQLSKTDCKDPETGEVRVIHNAQLWKDLPIFGWEMREWFNFGTFTPPFGISVCGIRADTMTGSDEVKGEQLDRLERQVKMIVLLMAHPDDDGSNDNSLYALWALREAFEETRPIAPSDVRLTAPWVLHVAKRLWQLTELGTDMPERWGVPGKKYADKEWKGFNKERWAVWRDGFVAAQAQLKDEEVKALAGRAAEIMKELEG